VRREPVGADRIGSDDTGGAVDDELDDTPDSVLRVEHHVSSRRGG
jgi:hypothetical protein